MKFMSNKTVLVILFGFVLVLTACRKDIKIVEDDLEFEQFVGDYKIKSMNTQYSNFFDTPLHDGVNRLFKFEGSAGSDRYSIFQYIVDEDHSFETGWRDTIYKSVEIIQADFELTHDRTYVYRLKMRSNFEGGEHVANGKSYEELDEYVEEGDWVFFPDLGRLKFEPHSGTETNSYERTDMESGTVDQSYVVVETNEHGDLSYSSIDMLTGEEFASSDVGKILRSYHLTFIKTETGFSVRNYTSNDSSGENRVGVLGLGEMNELWKLKTDMILERQ